MNKSLMELVSRYRLDYLAYVVGIFGLVIASVVYPHEYLPFIAIACAWLPLVWHAYEDLKKWQIGTDFFIVFATVVGLIGKEYFAILIILSILIVTHYIEMLIDRRTEHAIEQLINLMPSRVIAVTTGGHEQTISLADMTPGMQLLVKTGGRIPADGHIVMGSATINQAALTGESLPQLKSVGEHVFAGTFIQEGSIIMHVEQVREETLFGKMMALFAQAEKKKSNMEIFSQRAAFIFTPVVLIAIVLLWIFSRDSNLIMTLLIFGSPLELSLVTPLAVLAATVAAFRKGIIVKGGRVFERMTAVTAIIFDKTGTLTLGQPVVVDVTSFDKQFSPHDILKLAAIAERRSDHVVARAILARAQQLQLQIPQPEEYHSLVGHGVEMMFEGVRYYIGNRHFVEAPEHGNCQMPAEATMSAIDTTVSAFYLATRGHVIGVITVSDAIRPDAQKALAALRSLGIDTCMLVSGDRLGVTQKIAQQLGISDYHAEVFPDQKLAILDSLQQRGIATAMVGDGINDAAALKQANIGIAMGAMGMEPAIDAADVVLMTNNLEHIAFVRRLSLAVRRVIQQNLLFGFLCVHVLGVILTLLHYVTPIQAAFFHAIADLVIVLNATRLIFFE